VCVCKIYIGKRCAGVWVYNALLIDCIPVSSPGWVFGLSVWFGLVWPGLVWFGFVWSPVLVGSRFWLPDRSVGII